MRTTNGRSLVVASALALPLKGGQSCNRAVAQSCSRAVLEPFVPAHKSSDVNENTWRQPLTHALRKTQSPVIDDRWSQYANFSLPFSLSLSLSLFLSLSLSPRRSWPAFHEDSRQSKRGAVARESFPTRRTVCLKPPPFQLRNAPATTQPSWAVSNHPSRIGCQLARIFPQARANVLCCVAQLRLYHIPVQLAPIAFD